MKELNHEVEVQIQINYKWRKRKWEWQSLNPAIAKEISHIYELPSAGILELIEVKFKLCNNNSI